MALALGYAHPDHLLYVLTPQQLDEWETYHEIEPWGCPADDYRAALTTWGSVMPHVGRRRVTPDQFTPRWGPQDPLRPEDYAAKARRVMAAASGRVKKGE